MKDESPWEVMFARQPIWTEEDEHLLAKKRLKERLRYTNLPENENQENDEKEDE